MLRAIAYQGDGWQAVRDLSSISDLIRDGKALVWAFADVSELEKDLPLMQEEFGLDPLAVEDALRLKQRAKLEAYENHLFAVMHQLDVTHDQIESRQISSFMGRRWVLTIHEGAERTMEAAVKQLGAMTDRPRTSGIMHALADAVVDEYDALADKVDMATEEIEELVLRDPTVEVQRRVYALKQQLSRLRRFSMGAERVLRQFLAQEGSRYGPMFRDIHDHTLRVVEQVESVDQILNAVLDLQRSAQAHALNETTKRLTGWAAIIAVPTLIASIYGMNFALLPRQETIGGFYFAVGTMVATGLSLYVYFKRRTWI